MTASLTVDQRQAIASALRDVARGKATLWGGIRPFSGRNGRPLPARRRDCGYDGRWYYDLPNGWEAACADAKLIEPVGGAGSLPHWAVTDDGREFVKRWLPAADITGTEEH